MRGKLGASGWTMGKLISLILLAFVVVLVFSNTEFTIFDNVDNRAVESRTNSSSNDTC